jgi:hypothetical protein
LPLTNKKLPNQALQPDDHPRTLGRPEMTRHFFALAFGWLVIHAVGSAGCAPALQPQGRLRDLWSRPVHTPSGNSVALNVSFQNDASAIGPVVGLLLCIDGEVAHRRELAGFVWKRGPSPPMTVGEFHLADGLHRVAMVVWYQQLGLQRGHYSMDVGGASSASFSPTTASMRVRAVDEGLEVVTSPDGRSINFPRVRLEFDFAGSEGGTIPPHQTLSPKTIWEDGGPCKASTPGTSDASLKLPSPVWQSDEHLGRFASSVVRR